MFPGDAPLVPLADAERARLTPPGVLMWSGCGGGVDGRSRANTGMSENELESEYPG